MQVSGLAGVTAISVGGANGCALLSGGTVACWGSNFYGQLGNGTTSNSTTPVQVAVHPTVSRYSWGYTAACALLSDGTVDCWGYNANGELGNGTTTNSTTPVHVFNLTGAIAISVGSGEGGGTVCALLAGGTVDCWGNNALGQLGGGGYLPGNNSAVPVQAHVYGHRHLRRNLQCVRRYRRTHRVLGCRQLRTARQRDHGPVTDKFVDPVTGDLVQLPSRRVRERDVRAGVDLLHLLGPANLLRAPCAGRHLRRDPSRTNRE